MVKNKILIVEDEKITAMDLKFKLEDLNYEICGMAVNGVDAINLANNEKPDLVLMDITLKGEMNGINAAKSILNENIPLIFLTSHTDEDTFKEANQVPSYGFLNKPFDMLKLERTIELALNRSKIELDKLQMSKGETSILATQNPKLHEQAVIEFEAGKKYKNEFLTKRKENNTFTVLIIEDESITALDLKAKIEDFGYIVLGIEDNGEKAIELAKDKKPDLILMDISLKGSISGIDVSKQISHLNIPIVYLTGSSNDENIKNALETAPYGFISKPIFDLELEQILELTLIKHTDDFEKIFGTEISQTPDSQSTNKSKKEPKFKSLIRGILKK